MNEFSVIVKIIGLTSREFESNKELQESLFVLFPNYLCDVNVFQSFEIWIEELHC